LFDFELAETPRGACDANIGDGCDGWGGTGGDIRDENRLLR